MYIPNQNRFEDQDALLAFMRANNFATFVSVQPDGIPVATHLPLTITTQDDGTVLLRGHFAKANPQWQLITAGESLAIFTGPHAYISPTLYDKVESVPTWNYIAAHAYGHAHIVQFEDDPAALEALLAELIAVHEATYQTQWDGLSARYRDGMMRGIVGFELTVTRLEGKAKLSQNRSDHEQATVAAALQQSSDSAARETGVEMAKRLERLPD